MKGENGEKEEKGKKCEIGEKRKRGKKVKRVEDGAVHRERQVRPEVRGQGSAT